MKALSKMWMFFIWIWCLILFTIFPFDFLVKKIVTSYWGLSYMDHVPKCTNFHKAILVMTGRAHCFHDCIYITPILLLWDLRSLCVMFNSDHLYIYHFVYIYSLYVYIYYVLYNNTINVDFFSLRWRNARDSYDRMTVLIIWRV